MSRNGNRLSGYGSVFAAGASKLEDFLVNREAARRQAMLDEIFARDHESKMAAEQDRLSMQRESNQALADERKATQHARRQAEALTIAGQLRPGDQLDGNSAAQFRDAGLGLLVQAPGARFTPADAAAAPAQFTNPSLQPEAFTERETFRGTAAQLDEAEKKAKRDAYLSKLPADSYVRQFLEAQDATGDSSLPAEMFKPKEDKHSPAYLEYQDYAREASKAGGAPLSFDAYMSADANRKRPVTHVTMGGVSPGQATAAGKLADDFRADSKDFISRAESFGTVRAAAKNPSAAGDLSLIFSFMKILDPGSVVREGEFATAQNAASIPERVRNIYNRAINGERLNDDQRADFVGQAESIYSTARQRHDRIKGTYADRAKRLGIPSDLVVMDYGASDDTAAPAAPGAGPSSAPAAGASRGAGSAPGAAPRVRRFNPATRKLE